MNLPEVEEVQMRRAPIVRALCQVGFPLEPSLEEEKSIRAFRAAVREAYPGFQVEVESSAILDASQGLQTGNLVRIWNFLTVNDHWRIALSPTSLTLETTAYSTVTELVERFEGALSQLLRHIGPARRDRLGVRYVNALRAGGRADDLVQLVNPALRGIAGADIASEEELLSTASDTRLLIGSGEGQLSIKAGLIPPKATLDVHPVGFDERVFVLDFDLFDIRPTQLVPADTVRDVKEFHSWIYRAFRWSLSDHGFAQCEPVLSE